MEDDQSSKSPASSFTISLDGDTNNMSDGTNAVEHISRMPVEIHDISSSTGSYPSSALGVENLELEEYIVGILFQL